MVTLASIYIASIVCFKASGYSDENTPKRPLPDYSAAPIVDAPVSGFLTKKPFRPTEVTLHDCGYNTVTENGKVTDKTRSYQLTFRSGYEFSEERRVIVFICADEAKLDRQIFRVRPYKFGTEEYRKAAFEYKGERRSLGLGITGMHFYTPEKKHMMMFSSEISGRIEFGISKGDVLPGRIIMAAPDGSYIIGRFTAKVTRNNSDQ